MTPPQASRLRRGPARRADPVRTCVGCRRRGSPDEFVRLTWSAASPHEPIRIGRDIPGRGAWLCEGSPQCFDQAVKRRAFARAWRVEVSDQDVSVLRARLHGSAPQGAQPDGRAPLGGG